MLVEYDRHKGWIWFSSIVGLASWGVYAGLAWAAGGDLLPGGRPRNEWALAGAVLMAAAVLLVVLRRAGVRLHWLGRNGAARILDAAALLAAGAGVFVLGTWAGAGWAGPHPPSGNSVAGMWFGILGMACMLFAVLLILHRRVPSWWWIGSRSWWLKGHIWLGSLSALFILLHSAFRLGGALEQVLWGLLVIVLGTGIYGLVLQAILPHLLATRLPSEVPYEQIPHQCTVLRRRADELIESLCGAPDEAPVMVAGKPKPPTLRGEPAKQLREAYEEIVRPFLEWPGVPDSRLANAADAQMLFKALRDLPGLESIGDQMTTLERYCTDRRYLGRQERLHHWLHAWLFIHIPASFGLVILGFLHAFMSVRY